MDKIKWIIKHIVSRFVMLHLIVLCFVVFKAILNWGRGIDWPLLVDSNLYIKIWANIGGFTAILVGLAVSTLALIILFAMLVHVGRSFWDW